MANNTNEQNREKNSIVRGIVKKCHLHIDERFDLNSNKFTPELTILLEENKNEYHLLGAPIRIDIGELVELSTLPAPSKGNPIRANALKILDETGQTKFSYSMDSKYIPSFSDGRDLPYGT